jgi:epoxyqueuosine reductase QueG
VYGIIVSDYCAMKGDYPLSRKYPESQYRQFTAKGSDISRRAMLQVIGAAAFLPPAFQRGWGRRPMREPRVVDPSQIPAYRYRMLPVDRFPQLQKEYAAARGNDSLGRNQVYRDQIAPLGFKMPADFPGARSVIVMAAYAKNMYANFRMDGDSYRIMIPFQYYEEDLDAGKLAAIIRKDIVKDPSRRILDISNTVPLKLLAARSGLGRYARNSLIFVDGMGSYNLLYAFLTDQPCTDDPWTELQILDECNRCHACERTCPTRCISRWSYAVNIDKCLTLYNENAGDFPNWILGSMHHALMGCMNCKSPCPVNEGIAGLSGEMAEAVTEEETAKILKGTPDDVLLKSLQRKLRQFRATQTRDQFPILRRNLSVLIRV